MHDPAELPADNFAFFGYPSRPEMSRETLANAASAIATGGGIAGVTWEDLDISGRLIIDRITDAIDRAAVSVFDVTTLNENVMFEVGYAIGADRRIWLARDPSDEVADRRFREAGVLRNIGYVEYQNSHELASAFLRDRPFERSTTFYQESIEPSLDPVTEPSIFYMRSPFRTEAERELGRSIDRQRRAGIKRTIADPRESSVESLTWYAFHTYSASAVLVHLLRPERRGADIHNARCALISGLAHGMGRPVLMLAEKGYEPPIDYRDLLYVYRGAKDCGDWTRGWLNRNLKSAYAQAEARTTEAEKRSLSTELAGLRLGEPIAENEADRLSTYFVTTAHYREVIAPRTAVFVGRRGAGKTANFIKAASDLDEDRRNLVCTIQPADYDLDGLVRLLSGQLTKDAKGYVVESLWKYLLISEIALAALDDAHDQPAPISSGAPAWNLENYVKGAGDAMSRDFAVRLERAVASVQSVPSGVNIAEQRNQISEALHTTLIRELLDVLTPALQDKQRVAVLIDNLDQSWEHAADVDSLSQLLLGLLTTARKVGTDISRRLPANAQVTLGVFIRSDIFSRVATSAREPDKIPTQFLTWTDPEVLLQVIEERYLAGRKGSGSHEELWSRYFEPITKGRPTREYMTSRVQPRPRDILYLTNAAIEAAVRHRRTKVTVADIVDAERQYSQFAFEALLVEGSGDVSRFENLLFEFVSSEEIVTLGDVKSALVSGGVTDEATQRSVLDQLVSLSFLGQETHNAEYEFAENPRDRRRLDGLASRFAAQNGRDPRFRIHPAYQAYLDITASWTTRAAAHG
ncbi:MAG TPA: hypothetical protein VGX72_04860 [Solirubrobacteraceae bacterium]|nr:hypothetical protein [Solirubrobacteraceae bacterium]